MNLEQSQKETGPVAVDLKARRRIPEKSWLLPVGKSTGMQILRARLTRCGLPEDIVDGWLQQHLVVNLQKNAFVFDEATPADVIYFVRAGLVDVLSHDDSGRHLIIDIATPGDFLGFIDFSDVGPISRHLFGARARTRCEIGIITRERIESALNQLSPPALLSIGEHINGWWSERIQHWVTFTAMSARERLKLVLTRLAEKCGVEDSYGRFITVKLSHDDFALMIGNSRPMVSRLLREMVAERWLLRRHNHYVLCGTTEAVQSDHVLGRETDRAINCVGNVETIYSR
jgi:CRP-like cAMP-binding protein